MQPSIVLGELNFNPTSILINTSYQIGVITYCLGYDQGVQTKMYKLKYMLLNSKRDQH